MAKTRLTDAGKKWEQQEGKFVPWKFPDSDEAYVFEGDFYHHGVDLTADEVLNIMADQVFDDARRWAAALHEDPSSPDLKFAGIDFIGPVDGKWWEDKGTKPGTPFEGSKRYHKFGGAGAAHILTFAR